MLPFRQLGFQDDFAYHHSVREFLNTGLVHVSEWSAPTLIFQIWWGSIFSHLFGFSYKVLHLSTVVFFYFGLIAFYLLNKELNFGEKKSTISTLFLLTFPYILRMTFSFMTDIPFLSLLLISLYLSVISIKRDNSIILFVASLIGMLAYLERQIGLSVPISLIIVYLYKSLRERRIYLKNLLFIVLPAFLVYIFYNRWITDGNNLSIAQNIYIIEQIKYLKLYLLPPSIFRIRPTSEIYYDAFFTKLGYYFQYLFGLTAPILLFFVFPGFRKIIAVVKRHKVALCISIIGIGYMYLGAAYRNVGNKDFSFSLSAPPSILFSLSVKYAALWAKLWNFTQVIFFPLWVFILGLGVSKIIYILFEERKKYFSLVQKIIFSGLVLGILSDALYIINMGVSISGTIFLRNIFFIYFVSWCLIVFVYFSVKFKLKLHVSEEQKENQSLILFLVTCGVINLLFVLFAFFAWWEQYLIPLIPFVLLGIFSLLRKQPINIFRSVLIIAALLYVSTAITKIDYDQNGILWETAEKYINQFNIDPRDIGITNWTWIPYFYQEESTIKRVAEIGGDKYKIGQIHTWWSDSEYNYRDPKLTFSEESCSIIDEKWKVVDHVYTKSIFNRLGYCVMMRK